jgi:hypothetical protein
MRKNTPGNSALIVGIVWSSGIYCYANRKGIAFPLWGGIPRAEKPAADPDVYMGGLKTALVDAVSWMCVTIRRWKQSSAFVEQFAQSARRIRPCQSCAVYVRSRSTAAKE